MIKRLFDLGIRVNIAEKKLRCLPRKKAQSLTKAERKATVAKKVRGSKKGKQFVKNTSKAEYKKKS